MSSVKTAAKKVQAISGDSTAVVLRLNLQNQVTYCNDSAAGILGRPHRDIEGCRLDGLLDPETPRRLLHEREESMRAGMPWTHDINFVSSNGEALCMQTNSAPIRDKGRLTGSLMVVTPVAPDHRETAGSRNQILPGLSRVFSRLQIWQQVLLACVILASLSLTTFMIDLNTLNETEDGLLMAGNDRQVTHDLGRLQALSQEIVGYAAQTLLPVSAQEYNRLSEHLASDIDAMDAPLKFLARADLGEEERTVIDQYVHSIEDFRATFAIPALGLIRNGSAERLQTLLGDYRRNHLDTLIKGMDQVDETQARVSRQEATESHDYLVRMRELSATVLVIGIAMGSLIAFLVIRRLSKRLSFTREKVAQISQGQYFDWIDPGPQNELGILLTELKIMQIQLGCKTLEAVETARTNERIRQALDCVSTPVMLANDQNEIIYCNRTATSLFTDMEDDLRAGPLPEFSADGIIGSSIDAFHKHPDHQRQMLQRLQEPHVASMEIAGRHMRLTVNPVITANGQRIGTSVEWIDRTQEAHAEKAIEATIDAAAKGDFEKRIDTAQMKGFYADVAGLINQLLTISEEGIGDVLRLLKAISSGDLTQTIERDYEGVFGQIRTYGNETAARLREVVEKIMSASIEVNRGAAEISEGSVDLSSRTEQQASNLEETASAMEEMTSTVKQNADNAHQASQLASAARNAAENGGAVAGEAIQAVEAISTASKKISDIISVIDEIAFQTNLLALNASVEAARAGEQGRGFAVVASEVRNLAGRSATAAKEIKDLIDDSVTKVDNGVHLVEQSGQMLDNIVESVKKVTDIVAEIAAASAEQSDGIDQINRAITQIDEMTQRNAALVEESAAASQTVRQQANELDSLVRFFQIGAGPGADRPVVQDDAPARTERRAADRPWSGNTTEQTQNPAPGMGHAPRSAVAMGGDSQEWEEF